jgi:hypothetical protein
MPRWVEYESALASVFLPRPYLPGEGLCEWEILGQTEKEVYVWAMCQVKSSAQGAAMSAPAVIHLGTDGKVQDVQVPGDGTFHTRDVGTLFPPNIQKRIFAHDVDTEAMRVNITARRITHAPPLIALSGTPMP